jgi:hypothetical protein
VADGEQHVIRDGFAFGAGRVRCMGETISSTGTGQVKGGIIKIEVKEEDAEGGGRTDGRGECGI